MSVTEAIEPPQRLVSAQANIQKVRGGLVFLAAVLGAAHAAAGAARQSMNADGIAYLDMGDAFWRGDWRMAINAVWSPFYSWILGLAMHVLAPSPAWEFRLVHLVNFAIYLGALACFDFFWRQVVRYQLMRRHDGSVSFPAWLWWALGYGLFIWSSLNLIEIWAVTPDMCVAAFVYLAAGILMRIRMGLVSRRTFANLGVVLGFAYLAKAVMFPLGFLFIASGLIAAPRRAKTSTLIALASFLAVGAPLLAALSLAKGRPTFGEAGKLTYAWFVNGVTYPHWQGATPDAGTPLHPTRRILDHPPIYEFSAPVGGTYPVSYDPSYWYEGVEPHLALREQFRALLSNTQYYFDLFVHRQGGLLACFLVLYFMGFSTVRKHDRKLLWMLALPAAAAFAMYALVYTEDRYLGPFVVLIWAAALCSIRLPDSARSRRLMTLSGGVMLLFLAAAIVAFNLEGLSAVVLPHIGFEPLRQPTSLGAPQEVAHGTPAEIAEGLQEAGLRHGAKIAFLGYSFDASWARLARVQIVAEMYPYTRASFWSAPPAVQQEVLQALAGTSAEAIVAEPYGGAGAPGWRRVGATDYLLFPLRVHVQTSSK